MQTEYNPVVELFRLLKAIEKNKQIVQFSQQSILIAMFMVQFPSKCVNRYTKKYSLESRIANRYVNKQLLQMQMWVRYICPLFYSTAGILQQEGLLGPFHSSALGTGCMQNIDDAYTRQRVFGVPSHKMDLYPFWVSKNIFKCNFFLPGVQIQLCQGSISWMGWFPREFKICLEISVSVSTVYAPCKVPVVLKERLLNGLDKMVKA